MIDREKYLARQRRYNASAKGRARYKRSNDKRIYVGAYYVGREDQFPYSREQLVAHLSAMVEARRARQHEEDRAFSDWLRRASPSDLAAAAPTAVTRYLTPAHGVPTLPPPTETAGRCWRWQPRPIPGPAQGGLSPHAR